MSISSDICKSNGKYSGLCFLFIFFSYVTPIALRMPKLYTILAFCMQKGLTVITRKKIIETDGNLSGLL